MSDRPAHGPEDGEHHYFLIRSIRSDNGVVVWARNQSIRGRWSWTHEKHEATQIPTLRKVMRILRNKSFIERGVPGGGFTFRHEVIEINRMIVSEERMAWSKAMSPLEQLAASAPWDPLQASL